MSHSLQLSLLAALGLAAVAAQAQTSLPPVDISATRALPLELQPTRVDVSRVCPGYGEVLREWLLLPEVSAPVDYLVRFKLDEGQVSDVGFRHTPMEVRPAIRRAMRQVSCSDDGQAQQQFAFILRVLPERGDEVQQARVLTPSATQLAALSRVD